MHLAVDTATFSIRSLGVLLIVAGAILAFAAPIWTGLVLIAAGVPLLPVTGWLLRRSPSEVRERMARTLTLLGLPFGTVGESVSIKVPALHVDLKSLGNITIARFRTAGRLSARERLVVDALIKNQKSIRIII